MQKLRRFDVSATAEYLLLDEYAPSAKQMVQWSKSAAQVVEFSRVPEFVDREVTKQDKAIRNSLQAQCVDASFTKCSSYIKKNRQAVLRALPSNQLYWDQFWKVAEYPELVEFSDDTYSSMDGYQKLIQATQWWFIKDLAETGSLEVDHALALQRAARNWSTGYQSLQVRMIGIAIQGIILDQMSFAMAQAARKRDAIGLNRLAEVLKPASVQDLTWGPMLWIEQEFQLRSMKTEELKRFHKNQLDIIARHYIPISKRSWKRYWQDGVPRIEEGNFGKLSTVAIIAPAYGGYIVAERVGHFSLHIFPALMDIYAGHSSPGLPARPAPSHWRWEWKEGSQPALCLVAVDIHTSTFPSRDESAAELCVEYYNETAVSGLLRRGQTFK